MHKLAFIKHFSFAGLGFVPWPQKWKRVIGSFFLYGPYMTSFCQGHFIDPYYDPTAKAQFSNLVGKAIADFLVKRIDGAILTLNYEWAMRQIDLKVQGSRPDLLALLRGGAKIAIEAKGYSRGPGNVRRHKFQALRGPIPVQFAVASIAFNLYHRVEAVYYDPERPEETNLELWQYLSKKYYFRLLSFLKKGLKLGILEWKEKRMPIKGEEFNIFKIDWNRLESFIANSYEDQRFWSKYLSTWSWPWQEVSLLIPSNIFIFSLHGLPIDIGPFLSEGRENLYIDSDRVGILIKY